jgi:hypothetical protein
MRLARELRPMLGLSAGRRSEELLLHVALSCGHVFYIIDVSGTVKN